MTESQDVDALKRRGRRRLIGAIALMLLAVIVLPMVFDAEPRISAPPVNVRIPDEDGTAFKPRVLPPGTTEAPRGAPQTPAAVSAKDTPVAAAREAEPTAPPSATPTSPVTPPAAAPAATSTAPAAPAAVEAAKPAPVEPPPPVKPAATAPAPAKAPVALKAPTPAAAPVAKASPPAGAFMIPIAALAEAEKVKTLTGSLASAKIPYYTEPLATAKGQVTRVRAGPFASKEQADQALSKLKALGLKPGNVTARNG